MKRGFVVCLGALAVISCATVLMTVAATPSTSHQAPGNRRTAVAPADRVWHGNYGNLPLDFEINAGQAAHDVQFLARGGGVTLTLGSRGELILFSRGSKSNRASSLLRFDLPGARADRPPTGQDKLPGRSNYFIGSDPSRWRTGIPHFRKVVYERIYPGIDAIYYGNGRQLECDFVIAPGAAAEAIAIGIHGAGKLSVDANGNLQAQSGVGSAQVLLHAPVIYQETNGVRQSVEGKYRLEGEDVVRFELGSYDRSQPLIIDPVLSYSTFLGGGGSGGNDEGHGIAVDAAGNAYITGFTSSLTFPTAGALQGLHGLYDVFVTKMNANGTALLYSTYLGGSGWERGNGIAVDSAGNAIVTGRTDSTDFPTTPGALDRTCGSDGACNPDGLGPHADAFVTKLNATGSALVYSTYLGGSSYEDGNTADFLANREGGITVDGAGNAYVTGYTQSPDFPTLNSLQTFNRGGTNVGGPGTALEADAFLVKFSPVGALLFATYLGGSGGDNGRGVAVDGSGNAFIVGNSFSTYDFPTTPGAFRQGGNGCFAVKIPAAATSLAYATMIPFASCNAIDVDGSGNAYVTGGTSDFIFPTTPGAFQRTKSGNIEAIVFKLNSTGSALVYASYLGGLNNEIGTGIAVDTSGSAYVAGWTGSGGTFPQVRPFQSCGGTQDVFVTKINPAGSALVYSTCHGGGRDDVGNALALDSSGNAYVTGWTNSAGIYPGTLPGFPTTPGVFQPAFAGGASDAFVIKVSDTLPAGVDLSVVASDLPDPVQTGGSLSYVLTVSNTGGGSASGVTLTDTLPPGVNLVSAASSQGSCAGTGPVTCLLGTLGSLASATVKLVVKPMVAGTITNGASATANEADLTPANNSASVSTTVKNTLTADVSAFLMTSPNPVTAGSNLTYSVLMSNGGPDPATGVKVTDTLPAGTTFVSARPTQGTCSGTTTVSCNLGNVPAGYTAAVQIIVTPTVAGTINNTVSMTANEFDPLLSNNSATQSTTVQGTAMSVAVTAPNGGEQLLVGKAYTIQWSAAGSVSFFDVFYSTDGGVNFTGVSGCANLSSAARSCLWSSPGPATTQGRVRVRARDSAGNTAADDSDANFTIATPFISVNAPANSGVNWGYGTLRRIQWGTNLTSTDHVRVSMSTDGGATFPITLASSVTASQKSVTITVPALPAPTTAARIRVEWTSNPTVQGTNPANFLVQPAFLTVTKPNLTTDVWTIGTSTTIKWSNNLGILEKVKIELSTDGGVSYGIVLFTSTPSDGSQAVTVSSAWATTSGRVRITWIKNAGLTDASNQNFPIQ